jgi:hypothetical protein
MSKHKTIFNLQDLTSSCVDGARMTKNWPERQPGVSKGFEKSQFIARDSVIPSLALGVGEPIRASSLRHT